MVRLVGLSLEMMVAVGLGVGVGVLQLLCFLALFLEERMEVLGREYGLPGKLQALVFLRVSSILRLFHAGGRLSVAGLLVRIPVSRRGGIWKLIK